MLRWQEKSCSTIGICRELAPLPVEDMLMSRTIDLICHRQKYIGGSMCVNGSLQEWKWMNFKHS